MDDKKKIKIIDWFLDLFTSKEEKEKKMQEKKDKGKKLAKALTVKQYLIIKYNLNDTKRYGSKSRIIEVNQQDFKKILVEENIDVIYFNMTARNDLGVYDDNDYYFYYKGVRILTQGSMGDNGFFRYFIGPLFSKESRDGEEVYDQNVLEYVSVIPISNKELRDYLANEGKKKKE